MHIIFLAAYLTGLSAADTIQPTSAERSDARCEQPIASVFLVADGSLEWTGQAAKRLVADLKAELGSCYRIEEAWFDAAPTLHHAFAPRQAAFTMARPRTPMRDAMETGFAELTDAPRPRTMVVIAHQQFYPSTISERSLLDAAIRSETKVHTIHLPSSPGKQRLFRRCGAWLRDGAVRIIETSMGERGYAGRDTAEFLQQMAEGTGGTACVASGDHNGLQCARSAAAEIVSRR